MERFVLFGFCAFLLGSCSFLETKEKKTRERVDAKMRQIDWNSVDAYPLFLNCDETASKLVQKACFEQTLVKHLQEALANYEFMVHNGVRAEVYVTFVVDEKGQAIMEKIDRDPKLLALMPGFDGVISQCLKDLPPLEPALKKGIPVSTKYRIPILLNSN